MFFINAQVLDIQGRINLSKFFKDTEVGIIYNDDKTFEVLTLDHPKIAPYKKYASIMKVDHKGRMVLPVWVRKLAKSESFLVAVRIELLEVDDRNDKKWESVILKPETIALPMEKETEED